MKTYEQAILETLAAVEKQTKEIKEKVNGSWNYKTENKKEKIYQKLMRVQDLLISIRDEK